jgi:hypothetical protein
MIDPNSGTWHAIKAHAETEIEDALRRLESPGLDAAQTEFVRGQIKALRKILALAQPRPSIPAPAPAY